MIQLSSINSTVGYVRVLPLDRFTVSRVAELQSACNEGCGCNTLHDCDCHADRDPSYASGVCDRGINFMLVCHQEKEYALITYSPKLNKEGYFTVPRSWLANQ